MKTHVKNAKHQIQGNGYILECSEGRINQGLDL